MKSTEISSQNVTLLFNILGSNREPDPYSNERPGTDHVISGPMRGLEKNCTRWRRQTNIHPQGHGDSMTNSAQRGRVGENTEFVLLFYHTF